jgi:hypothetical protein
MAISTPFSTGRRRMWQWTGPGGRYAIVLRQDLQAEEARFVCRYPAQLFNAALGDPVLWRVLLEVWTHLRGAPPQAARTLNKEYYRRYFLPGLEEAFRNGQLVLLYRRREVVWAPSGPEVKPAERPTEGGAERVRRAPEKKKTWIEIVLVDENNRPVPGERFILQFPDASTLEDRLDNAGKVRVEEIDPGECLVSFPDIDAAEWKRA